MTPRLRPIRPLVLLAGALLAVAVVAGACEPIAPSAAPGASGAPAASVAPGATPAPTPAPSATPQPTPLIVSPATLRADPVSVLAWLFNPIFQLFLILMVGIKHFVGDMGVAIILTTLIVRTALVPLMRRQMVSMRPRSRRSSASSRATGRSSSRRRRPCTRSGASARRAASPQSCRSS